ncbi:MAG TPA: RNHCP domain-containing protein [Chloroflexota bacterium]|nr:RNHCP domain-containing protein [Chloroflexota bacterium]
MSRSYRRVEREAMPVWARPRRRSTDDYSSSRARTAHGETFRCLHCKTIVGPLPWGGRHRNHCPLCLHSRHVDGRVPGDRASTCGGKMAPAGLFTRPDGEQMLLHRCLACDVERHNRVAADDHPVAVLRLPLLQPAAQPAAQPGRPDAGGREPAARPA